MTNFSFLSFTKSDLMVRRSCWVPFREVILSRTRTVLPLCNTASSTSQNASASFRGRKSRSVFPRISCWLRPISSLNFLLNISQRCFSSFTKIGAATVLIMLVRKLRDSSSAAAASFSEDISRIVPTK